MKRQFIKAWNSLMLSWFRSSWRCWCWTVRKIPIDLTSFNHSQFFQSLVFYFFCIFFLGDLVILYRYTTFFLYQIFSHSNLLINFTISPRSTTFLKLFFWHYMKSENKLCLWKIYRIFFFVFLYQSYQLYNCIWTENI